MKAVSIPIPEAAEPKYVWFADYLRRLIETGELKPGDRLPSRTEIRALHSITQPTIERAQAILEREGLIVRRERLGVFVADPSSPPVRTSPPASGAERLVAETVAIFSPSEGLVPSRHRKQGWSDYITQGALAACRERGKHALLLDPLRAKGGDLRNLLASPPMGFIFAALPATLSAAEMHDVLHTIQRHGDPLVIFGNEPEWSDVDRVACDHEAGCYQLTKWLIGEGCRRILPLWPPMTHGRSWLMDRLRGYRRAVEEAGLEPLPVLEVPLPHAPSDPDDTLAKFDATVRYKMRYLADSLGSELRCDAILETSDGDVPGTAAACRQLGYEPNRDVLIAGYDNYWSDVHEQMFESIAPVATVDKQNWRTGMELVELLFARMEGRLGDEAQLRWIEPELIPRPGLDWTPRPYRGVASEGTATASPV